MAQADYNIANASAPAVRADLNATFLAIVSNNSGATAPATTFAYQWWYDTTANILKMRNAANSGWINIASFNQGAGTFAILGSRASQAQAEAGTENTLPMTALRVAQAIAALGVGTAELEDLAEGASGQPYVQAGWHPYNGMTVGSGNGGAVWDFAVNGNVASVTFNTVAGYDYRVYGGNVTGALNLTVEGFQDENSTFGAYTGLTLNGVQERYFDIEIPAPRVLRDDHIAAFRATPAGVYTSGAGLLSNANSTRITQIRLNLGGTQTGGKIFVQRRLNYLT